MRTSRPRPLPLVVVAVVMVLAASLAGCGVRRSACVLECGAAALPTEPPRATTGPVAAPSGPAEPDRSAQIPPVAATTVPEHVGPTSTVPPDPVPGPASAGPDDAVSPVAAGDVSWHVLEQFKRPGESDIDAYDRWYVEQLSGPDPFDPRGTPATTAAIVEAYRRYQGAWAQAASDPNDSAWAALAAASFSVRVTADRAALEAHFAAGDHLQASSSIVLRPKLRAMTTPMSAIVVDCIVDGSYWAPEPDPGVDRSPLIRPVLVSFVQQDGVWLPFTVTAEEHSCDGW